MRNGGWVCRPGARWEKGFMERNLKLYGVRPCLCACVRACAYMHVYMHAVFVYMRVCPRVYARPCHGAPVKLRRELVEVNSLFLHGS